MAGILDGEGCITIGKVRGRTAYQLTVRIAMANNYIGRLFQLSFGGAVWGRKPRSERERPQLWWAVYSDTAIDCLKALLPYLHLKRDEAELAIKFWAIKRHTGQPKGHHGNTIKTEEEMAVEEACYLLMHNLKDKTKTFGEIEITVPRTQKSVRHTRQESENQVRLF